MYSVSQCFQWFFNVDDLPTFFFSFFTLVRTITSHNIVCLQFAWCHFPFVFFSLLSLANEFRCVCVLVFFLFIISDQQMLGIRFSWSFSSGFLCYFSVCVRAIFFFPLFFRFSSSSKSKTYWKHHTHHTLLYHQIGNNSGYKWKSIQAKTRLQFNAFIL